MNKIEDIKKISLMNWGLICMFAGFVIHGSLIAIGMVIIIIDLAIQEQKDEEEN